MNSWFGRKQPRRNAGYVDYGRHLREQEERIPQVLWTLIGINVAVYVLWQLARGTSWLYTMGDHFTVSAQGLLELRFWTLLTSEFSHVDLWHMLFNMFALWVFGQGAAEGIGWRGLLWLYGLGAVAASAGHVGLQLMTGDPSPALGASGAVMAIAVVYALLYPNRTLLLNFFIPVPAWIAVTGYIVLDIVALGGPGDGVAHAAHLGGAAMGGLFWWWSTQRR
jgi:membrane associated rhomboid family serine protease